MKLSCIVAAICICLSSAVRAQQTSLFDNFQSGPLDSDPNWASNISGAIIEDPMNSNFNVVHFLQESAVGDLVSQQIRTILGQSYTFSFDYMGTIPVVPGWGDSAIGLDRYANNSFGGFVSTTPYTIAES